MPGEIVSQIENIFHPRSIAVTGVSDKSYRLGNLLLLSFLDIGFKGNLYPVNPREDRVMGLRCYPSVKEIEGPVDLAIVSVHPKAVPALIEDCAAKGVGAAVIFSSGFREKGEEGSRSEAEILRKARSRRGSDPRAQLYGAILPIHRPFVFSRNAKGDWNRCFPFPERISGQYAGAFRGRPGSAVQQNGQRGKFG